MIDFAPPSRGQNYMTLAEKRAAAAKIKKGGIIADEIKKESEKYHENEETPKAEATFQKELEKAFDRKAQTETSPFQNIQKKQEEFSSQEILFNIFHFFKRFFTKK